MDIRLIGYVCSVLIGVTLGLIGGGGSILAVPLLVYIFGLQAGEATFYSLFVVGTTSVVGTLSYFKEKLVDVKIAIFFGLPSVVAVFATRYFIVPSIPEIVFQTEIFTLDKHELLLSLFALLMILASYNMIRKTKKQADTTHTSINYGALLLRGALVGIVTGLVGAGGGFLIIPALVLFSRLPMKKAIGTSLVIVAINSLLGFAVGQSNGATIDWQLLLSISALAMVGIFVGILLSKRIDGARLKPAFGWFILVMGIWIIINQTLLA